VRIAGGLVAAALLAACSTTLPAASPAVVRPVAPVAPTGDVAVPEPPPASGAPRMQGMPATGDGRPLVRTAAFDVGTLPIATWGDALPQAGFTLHRIPNGWSLWVKTTMFAEVVVSASAPFLAAGTSPVGFSAFTGGSFGEGEPPDCGRGHSGKRLAIWKGIAPEGWTDRGVDVEMDEGDYDLATCTAAPVRSLRGRAKAVVPGFVYGLRTRDASDEDGPHAESVVFFLPRGAMVSATAEPETPLATTNTGAFTRLTFPLEDGSAASASVRLSPSSLRLWSRLRAGLPGGNYEDTTRPHEDLLLGLDVTRQGAATIASLAIALPKGTASKPYAKLLAAAEALTPPAPR
jgi:hypothetical protein